MVSAAAAAATFLPDAAAQARAHAQANHCQKNPRPKLFHSRLLALTSMKSAAAVEVTMETITAAAEQERAAQPDRRRPIRIVRPIGIVRLVLRRRWNDVDLRLLALPLLRDAPRSIGLPTRGARRRLRLSVDHDL